MTYHLTTAPLGLAAAAEFAAYLNQYAIQVAGLTVQHEDSHGRLHNDRTLMVAISTQLAPLTATGPAAAAAGVATGLGCAPTLAVLLAPVAAAIAPILTVAIPALLAANSANGVAMARYERKWGGAGMPDCVASHITFRLSNVSAQRLAWTEYLISLYCQRRGWSVQGLRHPDQWTAAARAAGIPTPWSQQPRAERRPASRTPKRSRPANPFNFFDRT